MPDPLHQTVSASQAPVSKIVNLAFLRARTILSGECWLWRGAKTGGYGELTVHRLPKRAHVLAYMLAVGPIPEGTELDHKCRNRACINPDHLEPVTHRENILRGETVQAAFAARDRCQNGHLFTADNVYFRPGHQTERVCKECRRASVRRWYAAHGLEYGRRRRARSA